jgi:hypothetical protein
MIQKRPERLSEKAILQQKAGAGRAFAHRASGLHIIGDEGSHP